MLLAELERAHYFFPRREDRSRVCLPVVQRDQRLAAVAPRQARTAAGNTLFIWVHKGDLRSGVLDAIRALDLGDVAAPERFAMVVLQHRFS